MNYGIVKPVLIAFFISVLLSPMMIRYLHKLKFGQFIRGEGPESHLKKSGTPTMGGIIIIIAIIIPCLLVGKLENIYMILMLVTTLLLGTLGFLDDYIKVFKKDKEGLHGKFKIIGQVGLGLIVGLTLYLSPNVVIRENVLIKDANNQEVVGYMPENIKSTQTTIPFLKNNNFDYADLVSFMGDHAQTAGWIIFVLVTIFIVTAVSNGANLTDGLDGLATGSSAIIGVTLGILAYLSGHIAYASYLNIMYIPGTEELVVFASAFIGATIGFLWYNAYPAQVFMGDTGSLFLGYMLAAISIFGAVKSAATIALLVPAIALGLPIMDTAFAILRRYKNGRPIFQPDKGHIHHRLLAMGFSQRQAVIFMYLISAGLCLAAVLLTEVDGVYALVLLGVLITIIFIGAKKIGILKDR